MPGRPTTKPAISVFDGGRAPQKPGVRIQAATGGKISSRILATERSNFLTIAAVADPVQVVIRVKTFSSELALKPTPVFSRGAATECSPGRKAGVGVVLAHQPRRGE